MCVPGTDYCQQGLSAKCLPAGPSHSDTLRQHFRNSKTIPCCRVLAGEVLPRGERFARNYKLTKTTHTQLIVVTSVNNRRAFSALDARILSDRTPAVPSPTNYAHTLPAFIQQFLMVMTLWAVVKIILPQGRGWQEMMGLCTNDTRTQTHIWSTGTCCWHRSTLGSVKGFL